MPITYEKIRALANDYGGLYRLKTDKVIGTATLDVIRKDDGHVNTRSLERLCEYYSDKTGRDIQPGDLLSYTKSLDSSKGK